MYTLDKFFEYLVKRFYMTSKNYNYVFKRNFYIMMCRNIHKDMWTKQYVLILKIVIMIHNFNKNNIKGVRKWQKTGNTIYPEQSTKTAIAGGGR